MAAVWTRQKSGAFDPVLINQLVMVAADVDNDLFEPNASDGSDGNALANLTYAITALYSGRDAVLGASADAYFGTRRLGRSGLADASAYGQRQHLGCGLFEFFSSECWRHGYTQRLLWCFWDTSSYARYSTGVGSFRA